MSKSESGQEVNLPISVATRVSQETADRLDEYRDRESMGRSVAVRQLLRDGLDRELPDEDTDTETETSTDTENVALSDVLLLFGGFLLITPLIGDPARFVPVLGIGLVGIALTDRYNINPL